MGVKFGMKGPLLRAKFHPLHVLPLRGEKPQNRPMSNLNNRRFALCAMLAVKDIHRLKHVTSHVFVRPPTLSQHHMNLHSWSRQ